MIFDTFDITFLKLCGLCRYMPTRIPFLYDAPFMQKNIVNNLQEHGLIKTQSDGSSYKLTTLGRNFLAGIGYTYPADARMDLHKKAYKRKLINAEINLLLHLAGFDVFYLYPQELAGIRTGYASSLTMRADKNNKVLSGSKFLGLLKIDDAVYIPYFVEDETEWVLPNFERSMILSQLGAVQSSKKVKLLLFGRNTEALWRSIHAQGEQDESAYGRKRFYEALQEMGFDYLLMSMGRRGVLQMSVLHSCRYRDIIADAIGCTPRTETALSECDGMCGNVPYIIAVDLNIQRICRALKQTKSVCGDTVPMICCLPHQKHVLVQLLREYKCPKTGIMTIDPASIQAMFPCRDMKRQAYLKGGECIEIPASFAKKTSEKPKT